MRLIELSKLRNKKVYERNTRYGEARICCLCCGKKIINSDCKWLQLTTDGILTDNEKELQNSQGCFSIGPACYKRFIRLATEIKENT